VDAGCRPTNFVARVLSGPQVEIVARGYFARALGSAHAFIICRASLGSITSPRLARLSRPGRGQHVEPDLAEVAIGGNHRGQPQLTHDRKAGAVRERQVLITILEEEVPRSFETIVVDTLPSQPGAAIDLLPPCARGGRPETEPKQGQGLVDDEVGRDQDATRLERCVTGSRAGQMRGIAPVRACHPTARIDEHGVHREYKIAS